MDKWTKVGLTLFVVGGCLVVLAALLSGGEVVLHETRSASAFFTGVEEYEVEGGAYSLWIEDIHPGFDDGLTFLVEAFDDEGEMVASRVPNSYETRTFAGVDCELVAVFPDLWASEMWLFDIEHLGAESFVTGDRMHIFLVRTTDPLATGLWGAGIILIALGVVTVVLTGRSRKD